MAKLNKVKVIGEFDASKVVSGAEEANKAIDSIGKKGAGVSKTAKKDWGGLADLFSNLLPRGMQRTIRGFKSSQRSIKRLGKSFQWLNKAMVGLAFGALLVILEQVIENWDKLTDAINGTTEAQRANASATKAGNEATRSATSELGVYLDVLQDETALQESRLHAMNELIKATGLLKDVDTETTEGKARVKEVYDEYINNLEKEAHLLDLTASLDAKKKAVEEGSFATLSVMQMAKLATLVQLGLKQKALDLEIEFALENRAVAEAEIVELQKQQRVAQEEYAKTSTNITEDLKAQMERIEEKARLEKEEADAQAKAERDAQRIRDENALKEKRNKEFLADLDKRLREEILLANIEDEQLRAEEELKMRTQEQIMKALDAGATAEQMLLIEEKYKLDLLKLEERFKEQIDDITKTPEEIAEEQERVREEMALKFMTDKEVELQRAQDLYDSRMELANEDRQLELDAQALHADAMLDIQDKYEDKAEDMRKKDADDEINLQIKKNNAIVKASRSVLGGMMDLAEEGSEQMKALAIVDILISQGVAVANSIKLATKASGDPFTMAVNIAVAIGTVLSAFAQVKSILAEADASGGGVGRSGGGGGATTPLVPQGLGRMDSPTGNQAYVVQSQLEGQALNSQQLRMQTVL